MIKDLNRSKSESKYSKTKNNTYCDSESWREHKDMQRNEFMTEDEIHQANCYIDELNQNKGQMQKHYTDWDKYETAYKGEQSKISNRPNTRINIVNANIEGQVSSMIDQDIAITTIPESPSDKKYAEWARVGLEWTIKKNKIKKVLDIHERRRLKFGTGILKVCYEPEFANGFGLVQIKSPPLNKVFVDNAIKELVRIEEASYICETIKYSKHYAKETYGEEKASAIDYGYNEFHDNGVFHEDWTEDDEYNFILIQRWSKHKGKLRLQELTGDGVLLYDSHKEGDRDENQKEKKYKHESYYSFINDRYPYFFTGLYPVEGEFYGFGDVKLLNSIQNMINDLYDFIRIGSKPNLMMVDTNSEVSLEDIEENSFKPRYYNGTASKQPVVTIPYAQTNSEWWKLLESAHMEAQKVTRYSDLMLGQGKSSDTATEAAIQQQQGNSSTNHKKMLLTETLVEVLETVLGLMMEFYTDEKAFRISEDKQEYDWIKTQDLKNVPIMKPATQNYKDEYRKKNPGSEEPEWMIHEDKNGKPMTKNVELDIEVSIGAGLPKNQAFLWQLTKELSQLQSLDENTGQPKALVSYDEMRKIIKNILHVPLDEDEENNLMQNMQQQNLLQMGQQGQQMGQNPNIQGLTPGGNPQMTTPNQAKMG